MSTSTSSPASEAPPAAVDIDELTRLAADAAGKLHKLEARERELALPALRDAEAAAELREVQAQRGEAAAAIRHAKLAREEHEREQREVEEAAREAERRAALDEGVKLARKREKSAQRIDAVFDELAQVLAADVELQAQMRVAYETAGTRALSPARSAYAAALIRAFHRHGVPAGLIELHGVAPKPALFAESNPTQPGCEPDSGGE